MDVLKFLNGYVDDFSLRENINLMHLVQKVEPMLDNKWLVTVKNLKNNTIVSDVFDSIFICNGHHWTPNIPQIDGMEYFTGKVSHSYEYRRPEQFQGKPNKMLPSEPSLLFFLRISDSTVLVIGSGPSGTDITKDLASSANQVFFSHHSKRTFLNIFPPNVKTKVDVERVETGGRVRFVDGSVERIERILFCTGYSYSFPFLSPKCEIQVCGNHVQRLFKHCVNIMYPTMFFIGLVFPTVITFVMDLQVNMMF